MSDINSLRIDWSRVDWALLGRYRDGTCGAEERGRVARWAAESPEHQAVLDALPAVVAASERAPRLQLRPGRPALKLDPSRRPRWPMLAKAAAVVLLVGGAAIAASTYSTRQQSAREAPVGVILSTKRGERLSRGLPDGSRLVLAPGSTLRLSRSFGVADRDVWLDGAAAFTVVHDAAKPFAVHTSRGVARDLGTRFVVRAYAADSSADVIVAEGAVALGDTRIAPRQIGRVDASGRVSVNPVGDLAPYFGWTEGRLVFRKMPLRDALVQLGRWYDLDIRLDDSVTAAQPLTATLEDEPAAEALALIAMTFKLELSRDGRRITLTPK